MNPAALAKFYTDVFEFKEEEEALEDPNFYLTDGIVNMILAPYGSRTTSGRNTSGRASIISDSR